MIASIKQWSEFNYDSCLLIIRRRRRRKNIFIINRKLKLLEITMTRVTVNNFRRKRNDSHKPKLEMKIQDRNDKL